MGISAIPLAQWLEIQKGKLMTRFPFYGLLLSYLDLVPSTRFPIAATDVVQIFYNPDRFAQYQARGQDLLAQGILLHECLHPALGHFWRQGTRDRDKWNRASDYVINLLVTDAKLQIEPGMLLDEQYRGLSEEEIYARLPDQQLPDWLADLLPPDGVPLPDGMSWNDFADQWRERVTGAAHVARQRGDLPAGIGRLIDRLLAPRKDWRQVLAEFVTPTKADYCWHRPNRRYLPLDLYFPTLTGEQLDQLVVAIDTSGSVTRYVAEFISELSGILACYDRVSIMVMTCDAAVHEVYELTESSAVPRKFSGGGGTKTEPVFDKVTELGLQPYALVYLTDGFASYPDREPEYPALWVLTPEHETPPWGRVTVLDELPS